MRSTRFGAPLGALILLFVTVSFCGNAIAQPQSSSATYGTNITVDVSATWDRNAGTATATISYHNESDVVSFTFAEDPNDPSNMNSSNTTKKLHDRYFRFHQGELQYRKPPSRTWRTIKKRTSPITQSAEQ